MKLFLKDMYIENVMCPMSTFWSSCSGTCHCHTCDWNRKPHRRMSELTSSQGQYDTPHHSTECFVSRWTQSHKNLSWLLHESILMLCEFIMLRCVPNDQHSWPILTMRAADSFFSPMGFRTLRLPTSARFHPMQVADCSHNFVVSTLVLSCPNQWATWLRERKSEGLDWLGTLSSHTWQEWASSRRKICLSNLLLGSLPDQVLRKLPRTDSLSVKATIRFPGWPGHHTETAINKASISNSWIMVCWSVLIAARMKGFEISSLKYPNIVPSLEYATPPTPE